MFQLFEDFYTPAIRIDLNAASQLAEFNPKDPKYRDAAKRYTFVVSVLEREVPESDYATGWRGLSRFSRHMQRRNLSMNTWVPNTPMPRVVTSRCPQLLRRLLPRKSSENPELEPFTLQGSSIFRRFPLS